MRDVAARASVDPSVVSRLLNDDPRLSISAATRERVLAAVHALDYRPNLAARALRTSRGGLIAFVVPEFTNQVYSSLVAGAHRQAIEDGYSIVIGEVEPDLAQLGRAYRARGVDGILLAGAMVDDEQIVALRGAGLPLVVVNRAVGGGADYVTVDYEAAAALAADHLLELGHREVVILSGPAGFDASTGRAAEFATAMRRNGKVRTRTVAATGITGDEGTATGHRLLDRHPSCTAVFTTTLMLAVGMLRAAHERGIRVPEQLSVLSIHDNEIAQFTWPPLTTVALPMTELGAASLRRLTAIIEGERSSDTVLDQPPRLVVRGSTALAPRD